MFRNESMLYILILTIASAFMMSCGGSEYRKQEVYYLVAANTKLPYWQAAKAGLIQAASEIGVGAEMVGPETFSPEEQKQALEDLLTLKVLPAGIMVSASNPEVLAPSIDKAVAKGINVITIDADAPKSKRLLFIGTDNYSVGTQAAEVTAEKLQNAGNVIVFTISGQTNLKDRLRGTKDVFSMYPAIRIIDTVDIKGDATIAFDTTKAILAKQRNKVDAFVCLESIACPEVADVLNRNTARDKIVVSMDTPERTLEWIQRGLIQATIAQKPFTMAYTGTRVLADLHKYPPKEVKSAGTLATVPEFINTGATLVNRANVDKFLKEQAKIEPDVIPGAAQ